MPIQFMGKEYASIDEMPPQVRQRYERMRDEVAKRYPDANADEALMELLMDEQATTSEGAGERDSKKRAWGGQQSKGSAPVPAAFVSTTDMGAATATYQVKRNSLQGPLIMLAISAAILIAASVFGANSLRALDFKDLASASDNAIVPGIFSVVLFGVGGLMFLLSVRSVWLLWFGIQSVVVYRNGFTYRSIGRRRTYRWTEIAAVVSDEKVQVGERTTWTGRAYTIQKKGGEKVTLDNIQIEDVVALVKSIKRNAYALLLPSLTEQYNSNQPVTFGSVTIHRVNGIRIGGKQLAWDNILDVKVKQGSLLVTMKDSSLFGGYHKARASTIPNIEILCEIIGVDTASIELAYG